MLKASLIGNLGSDPEMKYTQDGNARLQFNVASNQRVKNALGNWDEVAVWVRVTVFGKRAETLAEYLKKGTRVFVDGRLEARPWTNNAGNPQAGLELIASEVEFMSSRQDGQQREPAAVGAGKASDAGEDRGDLDSLAF